MKIEHRTLNERAYDEIRDGLISGKFEPGQTLVIRTLAQNYGISITPVRDALQKLVAERLLEVLPNRSIAVPYLRVETFLELARIRKALEGLAAELALPRLQISHAQRLGKLIAAGEDVIQKHDGASYAKINQQFHFTIYDECGSPTLLRMITELWSQVGPFFTHLLESGAYDRIANDQHRLILKAVEEKNSAAVKGHIVEDIDSAAQALSGYIQTHRTTIGRLEKSA
jgi:DNA-binding GntR family transcriptional regulator